MRAVQGGPAANRILPITSLYSLQYAGLLRVLGVIAIPIS